MDVCLQFLDIFMNLNVILSNISYPHLKQHIAIQSLYKGKIKKNKTLNRFLQGSLLFEMICFFLLSHFNAVCSYPYWATFLYKLYML